MVTSRRVSRFLCVGQNASHDAFLWLNNDTRLSRGFVAGLLRCWHETGAGIVGPVYDCHWLHQRVRRVVPVARYRPRHRNHPAPFIDGTAMFVPASTVDAIGLLDAETFAPIGWGAEIDYSLRARENGLDLVVTRLIAGGTHKGEYHGLTFKGIPPTGKQVTWSSTEIFRLADGKIVEHWINQDVVGRLRQMGALPTPGQASESPL